MPVAHRGLGIVPYLGAVARVDPTATAFAHRAPGYSLLIVSQWADLRETEPNIAWAKETFEALHPHMADRSYANNPDRRRRAHGAQTYGAPITNGSSRPSAATTRTTFSGSTTTLTHPARTPGRGSPQVSRVRTSESHGLGAVEAAVPYSRVIPHLVPRVQ